MIVKSASESQIAHTRPFTRPALLTSGAILVVSIIALGVRLYHLATPNLWGDEWFTIRAAHEGILWYLDQARVFEPNPPLHPALFTAFSAFAGDSEFALRFFSAFFGVLGVVACYALGRALFGKRAGLIAALLMAVNPYQIAQSQNGRSYTMVTTMVIAATLLLFLALTKREKCYWIGYAALSIAMLYTHYNVLFVLLGHGILVVGGCILFAEWRREVLRPALWTAGAFLIGVLPWLIHNGGVILSYKGFYPDRLTPIEVLQRTLLAYAVGQQPIGRLGYILALGVAVLALIGLVYAWKKKPLVATLLGLGVAGPLGIAIVMFLVRPMFEERYLIVLAPAYVLLAAFGLSAIWGFNRVLGVMAVVAIVIGTCYALNGYYPWVAKVRPDYRGLTQWVETVERKGEVIACTSRGANDMLTYYYKGTLPIVVAADKDSTTKTLEQTLSAKPEGIWQIPASTAPTDQMAKELLSRQAYATAPRWFNDASEQYYAVGSDIVQPKTSNAVWTDWLQLDTYAFDTAVEATQVIRVELNWDVLKQSSADYKISLRMFNATGQMVMQLDRRPVNGLAVTNTWKQGEHISDKYGLFIPAGTAPGIYRLEVVVYDANTGKEASAKRSDGTQGIKLELGSVTISPITRQLPASSLELSEENHLLVKELTLESHYIAPPTVKAGESLLVSLLWRAPFKPTTNYAAQLEMVDEKGNIIGKTSQIVGGNHPTMDWIQSEAIRQFFQLPVSAAAPTGSYRLRLRINSSNGEALLIPGTIDGALELERVNVVASTRSFDPPTVQSQAKARFGEAVALLGYEVTSKPTKPGEPLVLTLYWKALGTADHDYTVFTHLLDSRQQILAQKDQKPVVGERPTTTWVTGEYITDRYELQVDMSKVVDDLGLEIGLYDAASGVRLSAVDESGKPLGDHITIPNLTIGK